MRGLVFALALAALAGCGTTAHRPPQAPTSIQQAVGAVVRAGAPGVVLFARHGNESYTVAAGVSDLKTKAPMLPTETFRVGSVTKSFLATLVLALSAEGKLSLEDPLEKYLPKVVPGAKKITIRQLLDHSSGLFNYTDDVTFRAVSFGDLQYTWTPRRLVRLATAHGPLFPPGTRSSYSNTNYVLLGLVVERVTGSTVAQELLDRVIWPLELARTSLPADVDGPPGAHGYVKRTRGGPTIDVTGLASSWAWSAGALVATGEETGRFYTELLRGRIVAPQLVAAMETTLKGSRYGLGLQRFPIGCGNAWGQTGNFPGYLVFARTSSKADRQVVLLVNADSSALPAEARRLLEPLIRRAYCG